MNYEGVVIRPPSEANSLILQVTVGCSHNKCIFCPAYKAKRFGIKSLDGIMRAHLFLLADQLRLSVKERDLKASDLLDADEVFVTNTIRGIRSVRQYNERFWERTERPLTRFLQVSLVQYIEAGHALA